MCVYMCVCVCERVCVYMCVNVGVCTSVYVCMMRKKITDMHTNYPTVNVQGFLNNGKFH